MDSFQHQLEGIARPRLLDALMRKNASDASKLLQLYIAIGVVPVFDRNVLECGAIPLRSRWEEHEALLEKIQNGERDMFSSFLSSYYEAWLQMIPTFIKWVEDVYKNGKSREKAFEFVTFCATSYNPSLQKAIQSLPLPDLVQCYVSTRQFFFDARGNLTYVPHLIRFHD